MIVNHANGLHECVTDCRADELKATCQQVATKRIRFFGLRHQAGTARSFDRFAVDEPPHIIVEAAKLFLNLKKGPGVLNR